MAKDVKDILRRALKNMTQEEFGEVAGVSGATVSRWLNGNRKISKAMEKHIRRTAEELREKGTAA